MSTVEPLVYGHYYHLYNRGINGANLFVEERNYSYFLQLYRRYVCPVVDTYAYCLLGNHFHLLVRMKPNPEDLPGFLKLEGLNDNRELLQDLPGFKKPAGLNGNQESLHGPNSFNYSQRFANLFNAYTKAINKAYQRTGSLFEKNFKRIPIDSERHLLHLVCYIHRNPQKHGLIDDFRRYRYSSYQAIRQQRPSQVCGEDVLQWFGNVAAFERYHQQFDDKMVEYGLAE